MGDSRFVWYRFLMSFLRARPWELGPKDSARAGLPVAVAVFLTCGCREKDPGLTTAAAQPAAAEVSANAGVPSGRSHHYSEASFTLEMVSRGAGYQVGKEGQVAIELSAKSPYKVNAEYPFKFIAEPSPGIRFAQELVGKEAVQLSSERATMTVAFTPLRSGSTTVSGEFKFSVCTAERCLLEKRGLALDVVAR